MSDSRASERAAAASVPGGAAAARFDMRRDHRAARLWSPTAVVLAIVAVVFIGDLLVSGVYAYWFEQAFDGWYRIAVTDVTLSALCALLLVPLVRDAQRRARLAEHALDIASVGFLIAAPDGRLLRVNRGLCELAGRTARGLLRLRLHDLVAHDAPHDPIDALLQRARSADAPVVEARLRLRADGVPVLITAAWLAEQRCFAVFVRDESARLAAERVLREHAESTQRLLDAMAEGVLSFGADGRCRFANRSAAQLLGAADARALLGATRAELFAEAADAAAVVEPLVGDGARTATMRRRDGSLLPVEFRAERVDVIGGGAETVLTFVDITPRLRLQQELARSLQRLREIFALAPVGMATLAPDGRFLQVNAAFCDIVGRAPGQLLAQRWSDVTASEDVGAERALIERLLGGGEDRYTLEKRYLRPDGSTVWTLQAVALVRDDDGRPDYLIAVTKDIEARKRGEAALRAAEVALRANAAKTEFLSRMSHELRTPLNAVLGFAQVLRLDTRHPLAPAQRDWLDHITRAGEHLLALINDVLDLTRVEAGRLSVSLEGVDLGAVAEEAAAMLAPQAAACGVQVRIEPDPSGRSARVRADRLRLRQVLVNVLSNAIKYNRRGGSVTLAWMRADERWSVRVADTGRGIAAEHLTRLFEPFNRLGAEREGIDGTGIGLALSRHLMQAMGGEIAIRSTPGEGTVVLLTLPAADAEVPPAAAADGDSAPPAPQRALTILYAEDNRLNAEVVRLALQQTRPHWSLRLAASGAEALRMAQEEPPDLVLVDMHLGDMHGLQLARALRAEARTAPIPLVALSADALPEQIDQALAGGFAAYLTKPVRFDELLPLLDQIGDRSVAAPLDTTALRAALADDAAALREVLELFRATLRHTAAELQAALRADDRPAMRTLAHKLKSASLAAGAGALADVCASIEQLCAADDPATAQREQARLAAAVAATEAALQRQLASPPP